MSDIININVAEVSEEVTINVTPNVIEVNITQSSGTGGGAVDSVNGQTGIVVLDKTNIGLGNVDNTSDANKPISTATQTILNKKMEWIVKDTTASTAVTGTTTRTQIGSSVLIPANTFNTEDVMMLLGFGIQKSNVNGTMIYRFLHNTENTLSGASSIAVAFLSSTQVTSSLERTFEISGGLLKCRFSGTTVSFTDKQATNLAGLSIAFNPTIDNYFFTAVELGNAADSVVRTQLLISK